LDALRKYFLSALEIERPRSDPFFNYFLHDDAMHLLARERSSDISDIDRVIEWAKIGQRLAELNFSQVKQSGRPNKAFDSEVDRIRLDFIESVESARIAIRLEELFPHCEEYTQEQVNSVPFDEFSDKEIVDCYKYLISTLNSDELDALRSVDAGTKFSAVTTRAALNSISRARQKHLNMQ